MATAIAEIAIAAVKTKLDELKTDPGGVVVEQDREDEFGPAELPAINMVVGDDDEVDRANGISRHQVTLTIEIYVDAKTSILLGPQASDWAALIWQKAKAAEAATDEIYDVFDRGRPRVLPDEDNAKPHLYVAVLVDVEYHVDPGDPYALPSAA